MESLWPDHDSDSAANNLRLAIHSLRQTLNGLAGNPKNFTSILRSQQGYYLNPAIEVIVDSEQFEHLCEEGKELDQAGKTEEAIRRFGDAVELYRGDYLEDEMYLDSTSTRREALKDTYLLMLDKLTDYYLEHEEYEICIGYCQRIITRDPYREYIYRKLMRCFSRIGQRNRALQWYENCCKALQSGLDTVPDKETASLHERLVRGEQI
jgi:DNA-binding SARP family transcriptional activator